MNWKKIIIGELSFKRAISSIVILYCFINVFAYVYSEKLIFPYNESSYDKSLTGLKLLKSAEDTNIATRIWKAQDEKYLILYFHGNNLDIGHLDKIADEFNSKGYSVLAMDYRGYGLSQGQVSEVNAYQDSQIVYQYALSLGYKPEEIIILGRSVGSGVATELAVKNPTKALILISPFTSVYRVMTKYPLMLFDKFNNLAKINRLTQPLLIIHGNKDVIIKPWHSQSLFEEYQGRKQRYVVQQAGHNDIWSYDLNLLFDQIEEFLKQ